MNIRGEYWIIDGASSYADGDLADKSHVSYANDHVRDLVCSAVGYDYDDSLMWEEEVVPLLAEHVCVMLGLEYDPDEADAYKLLLEHRKSLDLEEQVIRHALDCVDGKPKEGFEDLDIRVFMARRFGWKAVHRNRVSTWTLTKNDLQQIHDGLVDILDVEGNDPEEDDPDHAYEIFVAATGNTYSYTLEELRVASVGQPADPVIGPNAQVTKLDQELQHPYYRK